MCLYLRETQPRVAKEDITVLKYVKAYDNNNIIISPFQSTVIHVNELMTASPIKEDVCSFGTDILGNDAYSINGGAIHARLINIKGGFLGCECRKAIIPSGTEYWISVCGDEIAARSMIITDIEWDNGDNKVSKCIFKEILENAPEVNGVRIGDYLLENGDYARPRKGLSGDEVVGIVAGFHDGEPLITALSFFDGAYDLSYNSNFGERYDSNKDAIKAFNGRSVTEDYRVGRRNNRFEAFEACINYRKDKDEEWYLGAAGEIATMIDNCIYLNAAHQITKLGFLIGDEYYNSCSENNSVSSWCCCLPYAMVRCYSGYKNLPNRTVPFLSSKVFSN